MILYPAIDLKNGQCVRLLRGDMDKATVFSDTPGVQAASFQADGCEWVHVVDLNGAFAGKPVNAEAVQDILSHVSVPVQLGGGIRSIDMIEDWLDAGVSRVILGTIALNNPQLVKDACKAFPGKVAVGIDALGGMVAVEGWAEVSDVSVIELAKKFEDCGVAAIIYTDIDRDGAMQGPNVESTKALADAVSIGIIASGGVSSLDDLRRLRAEIPNLNGAISGRALYDGKLHVPQAVAALRGEGA